MKISISGRSINIGNSLHEYIEDRLTKSVEKYLTNVTKAEVVISKNAHQFHVSILMHESIIGSVKATSDSDEVYAAFDGTLIRIEKQLRKYRQKILKKSKKGIKDLIAYDEGAISGKKYVLSSKSTQMPLCILYEDTKQITLDLEAFPEGNYVFLNEFYALIPKKYSH